ncbi:MAG TPA: nuclear transport factor 2 family protein, partial [Pseudomonadales bacterium]|nr:nuclear transport factor 2 family protein [Pseudomonadales bacterium]
LVVFADPAAREAVLAADTAFAALSTERGAQQAFQAYLANDGVVFRPTAVAGGEWFATHEQASGRLEWSPAAAAVDCAGGLAVTTGPWRYRNPAGGDPVAGHYLSLWRQDANGEWFVVLDHGIDESAEAAAAAGLQAGFDALWPAERDCSPASGANAASLAKQDRELNSAIRSRGIDVALRRHAHAAAVAYRDDAPPRPVTADWPADAPALGSRLEGRGRSAIAAPGSDMGYTYGEIVEPAKRRTEPRAKAVYVRVWLHDGRSWRLALDMSTPLDE